MPKPLTATNILAEGACHTAFTYGLTAGQMCDWAVIMGIEVVVINKDTTISGFRHDIMLGNIVYR